MIDIYFWKDVKIKRLNVFKFHRIRNHQVLRVIFFIIGLLQRFFFRQAFIYFD